ncbi:MAG: phosphonate C-P lyase system protein PhnH [Lautropia sp.]
MNGAELADLPTGFAAPVADRQRTFRAVLSAMARPGTVQHAAGPDFDHPAVASPALTAVLLTLADRETAVWLSPRLARHPSLAAFARFFTGCTLVADPAAAALLCCAAADTPALVLDALELGSDEAPHLGATLVVDAQGLSTGRALTLTGPGVEQPLAVRIDLPDDRVWQQRQALEPAFPRGIELLFACGERLLAIPRSTHLELG